MEPSLGYGEKGRREEGKREKGKTTNKLEK
jgi:hypothetical protein